MTWSGRKMKYVKYLLGTEVGENNNQNTEFLNRYQRQKKNFPSRLIQPDSSKTLSSFLEKWQSKLSGNGV